MRKIKQGRGKRAQRAQPGTILPRGVFEQSPGKRGKYRGIHGEREFQAERLVSAKLRMLEEFMEASTVGEDCVWRRAGADREQGLHPPGPPQPQ